MKKQFGLGAAALAFPAAIISAALLQPAVAVAEPASGSGLNVVGEPYGKALQILKGQGVKAYFGGSHGGDLPQVACIVDQQKITSGGRMYLNLDCTQAAADHATDSTPAAAGAPSAAPGAPGAPAPGNGQGTYGGPIGVPVPVG